MSSIPSDYDTDAGRFPAAQVGPGDVHDTVGPRLVELGTQRLLDLGCGRGRLLDAFPTDRWIGVDASPAQLAECPGRGRAVQGDGQHLPFADQTFDAVAARYCLYHFDDPAQPIAEARRVLRSGGWFVTCTPSRSDAPELVAHHDRSTFDAEDAERHLLRSDQLRDDARPPLTLTKRGVVVWARKA